MSDTIVCGYVKQGGCDQRGHGWWCRLRIASGIRLDTLLMIGQFGQWKQPVAKDLGLASLNELSSLALSLTDSTGSTADIVRVKIKKAKGRRRRAA